MGFAIGASAIFVLVMAMIWIAAVMFGRFEGWFNRMLNRTPPGPPKVVTVDVPHCLGKAEARRRLYVADRNLANQGILNRRSIVVKWEDDRAYFAIGGITGFVEFGEDWLQIHAAVPDSPRYTTEGAEESIKRIGESLVGLPREMAK